MHCTGDPFYWPPQTLEWPAAVTRSNFWFVEATSGQKSLPVVSVDHSEAREGQYSGSPVWHYLEENLPRSNSNIVPREERGKEHYTNAKMYKQTLFYVRHFQQFAWWNSSLCFLEHLIPIPYHEQLIFHWKVVKVLLSRPILVN